MLLKGSSWLRWEPHIHAPGTVLEDRFGQHEWDTYISALEQATPTMRAIGITDYCVTASYERVKDARDSGRLSGCELLFPNIELRLEIGTVRGNYVNIHLLVSPEDPNHVRELNDFLRFVAFETRDQEFTCTPGDLVKLGKITDRTLTDDRAALRLGVVQFKVTRAALQNAFRKSEWGRANIIVAVSGNADGSGGVRDGADQMIRREIDKFAKVIFASSPKQRDFWLGQGAATPEELNRDYDGLKPCLWGCDAHELAMVGKPAEDRLCWIKGRPTFDALRQACIDPDRAYVGPTPPRWASESQTLDRINVSDASWLTTPDVELNSGLVTIIGARGSGKTALADMIAAACEAYEEDPKRPSFLERANEFLAGATARVTWLDGSSSDAKWLDNPAADGFGYPRARYLSQQFVDRLCSPEGMPDMLREMERVVYEAHDDRDGAVNFPDLLDLRASGHREARQREELAMARLSEQIGNERDKISMVDGLKRQIAEKESLIKGYERDRAALIPAKDGDKTAQRLQRLLLAAERVQGYLRFYARQQAALQNLINEVADQRTNRAPQQLRELAETHSATKLDPDAWERFRLEYKGNVDEALTSKVSSAAKATTRWKGVAPALFETGSYVQDGQDLEKVPLATLEAEIARVQGLIASDKQTADKLALNARRIAEEGAKLAALREKLADCEAAKPRRDELIKERRSAYRNVFTAILAEEKVLRELYAPLMKRLAAHPGTLAKLTFTVRRVADARGWAEHAEEELLDRRTGPLKGIGTLRQAAEEELKSAWETGSVDAIDAAMEDFRTKHQEDLLAGGPDRQKDPKAFREWSLNFAKWLFRTDHISIEYGIHYAGIEIAKLSPGTRGIVLVLLYLALDDADDKPLIIDQPEENLDPKSIYDELVPLFRSAKRRRQVIMVTHNANLVVNTDADQVIIAEVAAMSGEGLPEIAYRSGGLDEPAIRKSVCDILEGGEAAFRDRARRLHIRF